MDDSDDVSNEKHNAFIQALIDENKGDNYGAESAPAARTDLCDNEPRRRRRRKPRRDRVEIPEPDAEGRYHVGSVGQGMALWQTLAKNPKIDWVDATGGRYRKYLRERGIDVDDGGED